MAHKELRFNTEARRALEAGVNKLADAVRITLGPKGQYVVLDKKFGSPTITNDGVTIAREIELEDIFENQEPSSSRRSRPRPTTWLVTGPLRRPFWPRSSFARASRTLRPVPTPSSCAAASTRPWSGGRGDQGSVHRDQWQGRDLARGAISARSEVGDVIADAIDKVGKDGVVTSRSRRPSGWTWSSPRGCSSTRAT